MNWWYKACERSVIKCEKEVFKCNQTLNTLLNTFAKYFAKYFYIIKIYYRTREKFSINMWEKISDNIL